MEEEKRILRHGSLFSGIGGFDLAAEWMGWENVFHCEWNDFGKKVLNYYWPNAISYDDITKTDFTIHRGNIDIITGGFPCQPFSAAGKRKGTADDRHLWPEMLRAIREIKPTWIVGENVSGIISWDGGLVFQQVQIDLEAEGYEVQAVVLPACGVGAPHRRDRVWIIAHSNNSRSNKRSGVNGIGKEENKKRQGQPFAKYRQNGDNESSPNSGLFRQAKRQKQSMGIDQLCEKRVIAYSGSNGHKLRGFRNDRQAKIEGKAKQEKRKRIWTNNRGIGEHGDATNPGLFGQKERQIEPMGSIKFCKKWAVADTQGSSINSKLQYRSGERKFRGRYFKANSDTSNKGLQRRKLNGSLNTEGQKGRQQSSRSTTELYQTNIWEQFPTQSPVCFRNDGISSRLDGITFSKWRNESIKAAGNAIVPQVVYQIFKVIDTWKK